MRGFPIGSIPRGAAGVILTCLMSEVFCPRLLAQTPTVEYRPGYDETRIPTATSILTERRVEGRFGRSESGGFLSPSPNENSRFQSGAVYSASGAFLGMSGENSSSRFQAWWNEPEFESGSVDFSLYRDYFAARRGTEAGLLTPNPRPIQASRPSEPVRSSNAASALSYYVSGQYESDRGVRGTGTTVAGFRDAVAPGTASIRNDGQVNGAGAALPLAPDSGVDLGSRFGGDVHTQEESGVGSTGSTGMAGITGMASGGTLSANEPAAPGVAADVPVNLPSAEEQARMELAQLAAFEEHLELLLLQSPLVHPLSPVQVEFRDGTATVRGVVPKQENRIEAGKVLLTEPRVLRVDNKLSVMPAEQ
ncbi:MAG: BON domain-containing protein [Planctomycetia bacterium]|nr:BON domain-containing protein [Planctomycetia bacterium]